MVHAKVFLESNVFCPKIYGLIGTDRNIAFGKRIRDVKLQSEFSEILQELIGDKIGNVYFYAVRPGSYRNSLK